MELGTSQEKFLESQMLDMNKWLNDGAMYWKREVWVGRRGWVTSHVKLEIRINYPKGINAVCWIWVWRKHQQIFNTKVIGLDEISMEKTYIHIKCNFSSFHSYKSRTCSFQRLKNYREKVIRQRFTLRAPSLFLLMRFFPAFFVFLCNRFSGVKHCPAAVVLQGNNFESFLT